jgi:ubiquinone biosynthesis protein UbiJ
VHEGQHRIVLFLNHVLLQEPEATSRLVRQKGQVALMQWRLFSLRLVITPAGLLDIAEAHQPADLTLTVEDSSPFTLAQTALRGDKPAVQIAGDVQLAAEINWLVDHVRWDVEEDLARVVSDVPAHTLAQLGRRVAQAVRQFIGGRVPAAAGTAGETPA